MWKDNIQNKDSGESGIVTTAPKKEKTGNIFIKTIPIKAILSLNNFLIHKKNNQDVITKIITEGSLTANSFIPKISVNNFII